MSDLISRQAAIDAIMGEPTDAHYPSWYAERLEQLPSAQQERIIYGNMSDEEFEKWLYGHGICSPNIREPIPCAVVPLLIDDAISELPSAQPDVPDTNVGDLISRQAAIDALIKWYGCEPTDIGAFENIIEKLPSAQPERIRGRWIEKPHVHGVAYCSLCDYELHTNDTNFCPNCGAKMEVGENGNDA